MHEPENIELLVIYYKYRSTAHPVSLWSTSSVDSSTFDICVRSVYFPRAVLKLLSDLVPLFRVPTVASAVGTSVEELLM
jgi:hypothetical protein